MMAVLWNDVLADLASAKRHFSHAIEIFDEDFRNFSPSYKDEMAFQHASNPATRHSRPP